MIVIITRNFLTTKKRAQVKNTIFMAVLLTMLSACASEPAVVLPTRPTPASTEDAACLRQCDGNFVTCTSQSGSAKGRSLLAFHPAATLIETMADDKARSKTEKTCAEFLKYCYKDCEQFK